MSWLKRLRSLGLVWNRGPSPSEQRASGRAGNAILISLIIMASSIVISLGMASIVIGEIRNSSLVAPAERAYYKAESYVEQALYERKQDPNYTVPNKDDPQVKGQNYVCEQPECFLTPPKKQDDPDGLLKAFYASTQPEGGQLTLIQDVTQQLDLVPRNGSDVNTNIDVTGIPALAGGFRGIEVTVVAYPKSNPAVSQFPTATVPNTVPVTPNTPVFIDKKVLTADGSFAIGQGAPLTAAKEPYPSIATSTYRLRVKALGGNATITVKAKNPDMDLRSTDFIVQAVAEDSNARRGIQLLAPESSQISSVFDFVLFADYNLEKSAKIAPEELYQSITGVVNRLPNLANCGAGGAAPWAGRTLTLNDGTIKNTDAAGRAVFGNLAIGVPYYLTLAIPPRYQICGSATQPPPPGAPLAQSESRTYTYTVRPVCTPVFFDPPPYIAGYNDWWEYRGWGHEGPDGRRASLNPPDGYRYEFDVGGGGAWFGSFFHNPGHWLHELHYIARPDLGGSPMYYELWYHNWILHHDPIWVDPPPVQVGWDCP